MVEYNSWKREEDLENVKEVVAEFKGRVNAEVRKQERIDRVEVQKEKEKRATRKVYGKDAM